LDTDKGQICYSRAGHPPPIYLTADGKMDKLETGGMVLGFQEEASYKEDCFSLNKDDLIVIYSDGLTEAGDPMEESFDEWRLEEAVENNRHKTSREIIESIIDTVQDFTGQDIQRDDMTLVVIKKEE
jgi:sigma-B regulation protein RsbU (phosphoserine phosphatase)